MSGWVYNSTRWILGAVFIYASSFKLLEKSKNVYRHPGGILAWKGAKFPVEEAE